MSSFIALHTPLVTLSCMWKVFHSAYMARFFTISLKSCNFHPFPSNLKTYNYLHVTFNTKLSCWKGILNILTIYTFYCIQVHSTCPGFQWTIINRNVLVKNMAGYLTHHWGKRERLIYLRAIYSIRYVLYDSFLIQFKDSVHCAIWCPNS